jgi:drug/metabolite transporter (DMT)-like permease
MSVQALLLVIAAAILHAAWNLVTKQVNGRLPFFWVIGLFSSVICMPFVSWQIFRQSVEVTPTVWLFALVSAALHSVYFLVLQTGYRKADLSIVYPIARGSGPFISVIGAIILFNERPGWLALIGVALIISGVLIMTGLRLRSSNDKRLQAGVLYGTLTGLFIAGYTLWDRLGVVDYHVSALLVTFASMAVPMLLLTPVAWHKKEETAMELRRHWKQALIIAICQPLSYLLVLIAIKTTPVSYVAPARELSIVFGVFFGANVLKEADGGRRIIAALVMLVGIALLAVG